MTSEGYNRENGILYAARTLKTSNKLAILFDDAKDSPAEHRLLQL